MHGGLTPLMMRTIFPAFGLAWMLAAAAPAAAAPAAVDKASAGRATPVKWAEGLAAPQGLAVERAGTVLVVENGSGRVVRLDSAGKQAAVVAEGLKKPSWALFVGEMLYVAEREGNSVARIRPGRPLTRLTGEVIDPLGLAADPKRPGGLLVVSHRESVVRAFAPGPMVSGRLALEPAPFAAGAAGAKYGWRDIAAADDGTLYVTDEVGGAVLRRLPGGAFQVWAGGLSSPSGLTLSPRGELYVTEEGNGRLSRLGTDGKATVVAEGMGKAREVVFLDARTLLVSDREGGTVWKVTLPAAAP